MGAIWNDWPWVISVGDSTWDATKATDQTLWTLCSALNVSVLGIDIGIPTPKRSIIDIPYRNGSLSLTDDKDVVYESRRVSLRFETTGNLQNGYAAIRAFSEAFHGKTGFIYYKKTVPTFGYYPHFYGTMEVSSFDLRDSTFNFSINMDAFPYNIWSFPTSQTVEIDQDTIHLPYITVSSDEYHLFVSVEFDPDYPTTGVKFFGTEHYGDNVVRIPWGAGSASPFNANVYIHKPFKTGSTYDFATGLSPDFAGTYTGKVIVRYMVCQL